GYSPPLPGATIRKLLAAHPATSLQRRLRAGLLGVAGGAPLPLAPRAGAAPGPPPGGGGQTLPTLALVPPADEPVVLGSFNGQVLLDLGVFVEAQGADLELRMARPDYDTAPQAVLVEATT